MHTGKVIEDLKAEIEKRAAVSDSKIKYLQNRVTDLIEQT
jgi:hypothetical protein